MYKEFEDLPLKQQAGIRALVSHGTVARAARELQMDQSTLHRWLKDPDFRVAYDRARRQSLADALKDLRGSSARAVETLRNIMVDTGSPPSARVAAARNILQAAANSIRVEDDVEDFIIRSRMRENIEKAADPPKQPK